ncbi:MAG: exodeoxyribonuclease III [Candidatus Paceibacterota bacterium]|jgi:exodeoxyribonuclease-3
MKLISWNVNGIRAWQKKGYFDWFLTQSPDIFCLQETKAHQDQLLPEIAKPKGYHSYFDHSKGKKGYSGVAVYVKTNNQQLTTNNKSEILKVEYGLGIPKFDQEGRQISLFFKEFVLINCYFPNGGGGPERLKFKLEYYDLFLDYIEKLRKNGHKIIFCGDINTAHNEIDIARPKENEKHTGFLRIERDWMDKVVSKGYIDTFRSLYPKAVEYSWWDMKTFARDRGVGWRLDYFFVSPDLKDKIVSAKILGDVFGSDHCPIELEISL